MRTRSNVFRLIEDENTDWPAALVSYEKGVAAMRALDPPDTDPPTRPTNTQCWQYLAAVHGRPANGFAEDHSDPLWTTCQHGSWFFFPWHRMYLLTLEAFIQHFSGDAQWSVPYWYAIDPDDPTSDVLPKAFWAQPTDNALYVSQRSIRANDGEPIAGTDITSVLGQQFIDNLQIPNFSTAVRAPSFGGGEYATPQFQHDLIGALESIPHGPVHNLVGSDYDPTTGDPVPPIGFMTELLTAARDPIFWLHHSNIDRIWQMWLDLDPAHKDPGDNAWLQTSFTFPTPAGTTQRWTVGEVLDTEQLGYVYDTAAPPSQLLAAAAPVPGFAPREVGPQVSAPPPPPPPPPQPQLIGAAVNVPMGSDQVADIALSAPVVQPGAPSATPDPQRWLLRLDGVTGTAAAPLYTIYLNLPRGADPTEHPERRAGTISTFGVHQATRPGGAHDGRGLSFVFDITAAHDALVAAGAWNSTSLNLTFVPAAPPASAHPAFAKRLAAAPPAPRDLSAGRIEVLVT